MSRVIRPHHARLSSSPGGGLPGPDQASFALWEYGPSSIGAANQRMILDVITTGDSGATGTFYDPDMSHGARNGLDTVARQERNYRGQAFAWTARTTNFKSRLGFAFEDPNTCQSEDHFGLMNTSVAAGVSDPLFTFFGFHILDNYNGPAHENYHAIVVQNGVTLFDADTGVPVEILPYYSHPIAHEFDFSIGTLGASATFNIDGTPVASYSGTAIQMAAGIFFRHASLNGTLGHMVSETEFLYMDTATL